MLALLKMRNFSAEVICPGGGALQKELIALEVPTHNVEFGKFAFRNNPIWHLNLFISLRALMKEINPDAVVINLDGNTPVVSMAAYTLGLPIVRFCRFEFRPPSGVVENLAWTYPQKIICPSECVARSLRNWLTPERRGRVHVLYDAYDGKHGEVSNFAVQRTVASNPGRIVIGYVGRLHRNKRVEDAISAFAVVHERFPLATLIVAGANEESEDGDKYKKYLVDLTTRLGVSTSVEFLGYVPPDEMTTLFRDMTACILPSESESFGMVLVEAWSQSVPTVSSDVGGCREITTASGGGLLAPVGDVTAFAKCLLQILDNPAMGKELGRSGASWVDQHCRPEAYLEGFLRIISEVKGKRT